MRNSVNVNSFTNVFDEIGKRWMLITAESGGKLNTMTASWGGMGVMWNMPVVYLVIRPQRYTREILSGTEIFTASFFPEACRPALNLCGTKSGRDCDKITEAGLTPERDERGYVYFEQAERVLCLRKLYVQQMEPSGAVDTDVFVKNYPGKDYHFLYIAKIEDVLE